MLRASASRRAVPIVPRLSPRFPLSRLLPLALLLLTGAPASGQQISAVNPPAGTLGTALVISGSDFGAERPKVFLSFTDAATGAIKLHALKVSSYAPTAIGAQILAAQAGPCTLHVLYRSGGEASAPFEIMLPHVTGMTPVAAAPGQSVQLSGEWFGSKAVKVELLGQRAKVLAIGPGSVTIEVPKKGLPDGTFTPRVSNALGSDWADVSLVVSGSSAAWPPDRVKATVDGSHFVAQADHISPAFVPGPKLAFDAYQTGASVTQLSLLLPFNIATAQLPAVYSGTGFGNQPLFVQVTLAGSSNAGQSLYTAKPASLPWNVTIVGKGGNHVAGVMQATLLRVSGPGPDTITLSDGRFLVTP